MNSKAPDDAEQAATRHNTITTIAALIVNWNRADMTLEAVTSVIPQVRTVYVLDNGSHRSDELALRAGLRGSGAVLVHSRFNLGYAGGNNLLAQRALADGHDCLLVMNNDATAELGAVALLADCIRGDNAVGAVMPAVVSMDGRTVLHGACSISARSGATRWEAATARVEDLPREPQSTGYVSGEAFLCRAEAVRRCGFFDERFFCYYEDVEWSLRLRNAGWRLVHLPSARFRHAVGGAGASSAGAFLRSRNRVYCLRIGSSYSRPRAAAGSAGTVALSVAAHVRRGRLGAAGAVGRGFLAGVFGSPE
jgi:GT2 family glycosyltransferase